MESAPNKSNVLVFVVKWRMNPPNRIEPKLNQKQTDDRKPKKDPTVDGAKENKPTIKKMTCFKLIRK